MGCFVARDGAQNQQVTKPLKKENSQKKEKPQNQQVEIKSKDQFQISTADLISEKTGKITKDYTILNPALGRGAFGEVRKAIHKKSQLIRAIKIISRQNTTKEDEDKLVNEVQILRSLDHPNIIKIFEFYQDDRFFYIVTELCTGGELFDKIIEQRSFSEKKGAIIMRQLLSAVFYCHCHQIVHRDLKPENLLLESKNEGSLIKVIDFGTSRVFDDNKKMHQKFGTPYYIAPEVLKKKYDEKCDIWSCGIILYIMLCGYPPFNGPNDNVIMHKVQKGVYDFNGEEWKLVQPDAKQFIRKMLEYNPEKRYTAEQACSDPWMKKWAQEDQVEIPLLAKALDNMKNFRAERKLQEATFVFLVNYLASKEEKNELLKTFKSLDINNDGQLSRDELVTGYTKIMGNAQAQEEVDRLMKLVDRDNSGHIDYTEFVIATINREKLLSKQRLETVFKMFDKDGSGTISIAELKEIFGGKDISDDVWKEVINEVDDNDDGEISYKEFVEMMLKMVSGDPEAKEEKEKDT